MNVSNLFGMLILIAMLIKDMCGPFYDPHDFRKRNLEQVLIRLC
jgi:hypothetical protein